MTISTIGAGGTYTSPQAWEDAAPATLTEDWIGEVAAEQFTSSGTVLNMSGVDQSGFAFKIRPQSGAGFKDVVGSSGPLKFDDGGQYARFKTTGNFAMGCVQIAQGEIEGIQLSAHGTNVGRWALRTTGPSTARDLILYKTGHAGDAVVQFDGDNSVLINSLVECDVANANGISLNNFSNNCVVANCTIIKTDSLADTGSAINNGSFSDVEVKNTLGFGFENFSGGAAGSITVSDCTTDDAATGQPIGTNVTYGATYANQFESPTTPDYRMKAGSDGENDGSRDQANTSDLDIFGTLRSTTTPDQGCHEIATASQPAISGDIQLRVTVGGGMVEGRSLAGDLAIELAPAATMLEGRLAAGDTTVQFAVAAVLDFGGAQIAGDVSMQMAVAAALSQGRAIAGGVPIDVAIAAAMLEGRQLLGDTSIEMVVSAQMQLGAAVPFADLAILDRVATLLSLSDRAETDATVSDRAETLLSICDRRCA